MPRLLIAGCGYVGTAAADLFAVSGWEVEGWTASEESARALSDRPYDIRAVDFTTAPLSSGVPFDVVIQAASTRGGRAADYRRIYFAGARNLAAAFPQSLHLFASSTSVYAQTDGSWVTEESAAEPATETGRILRETEELVLQRNGIVARLAGIYGPGRSALLRKLLSGDAVIDPTERYVNQAHRDDIAAALLCLSESTARGQIYNISDGNPLLLRECYEWLAAELNKPVPPIALHSAERKRGRSNKRVSNDKLRALGWAPQFPAFESAMRNSILPNFATCGA
ncbi:MAG: NAD-dependent epimerase/dehydratase family protein [Chthoniobacterales bacterium]